MTLTDLRPRGTVEVKCQAHRCNRHWWVDSLDPRLTDPVSRWDCGQDHATEQAVDRHTLGLQIYTGVAAGCFYQGAAILHDRYWSKVGYLTWDHPDEIADPFTAAERVVWEPTTWPMVFVNRPTNKREAPPTGMVDLMPYNIDGQERQGVWVPCSRPKCTHHLLVDYRSPSLQHTGGDLSYGGKEWSRAPEPKWWPNRAFLCEQGLVRSQPQPCKLIRGEAIAAMEAATGARWTAWDGWHGTVLFREPGGLFGLLSYADEGAFASAETIAAAITWGSLAAITMQLQMRHKEPWDDRVLFLLWRYEQLA